MGGFRSKSERVKELRRLNKLYLSKEISCKEYRQKKHKLFPHVD
jgi:hypothetical protein